MNKIKHLPSVCLVLMIKLYRIILSPLLPSSCRHYPTCSEYAVEAINKYGVLRGGYMSVVRILKCNPLFKGGYDPVH